MNFISFRGKKSRQLKALTLSAFIQESTKDWNFKKSENLILLFNSLDLDVKNEYRIETNE
jgi:hypothetical protein